MARHLLAKLISGCLLAFIFTTAQAQNLDLLIRHAKIVDGSGNPWFYGDIGVANGEIVAVGDLTINIAKKVIDARGMVAAPGFIDVHTHIEQGILEHPLAENYLYDGVTTVITGNCGSSGADLVPFFEKMEKTGIALNVASLIGHNGVRKAVMGTDNRQATPDELRQMEVLVEKAMKDGAVGLSTGLIYVPGTYANTEEVVALAKVAAWHGGVYASHIRNEDHRVFDAIAEAVHIGKEADIPVEISHFKISGKASWGASEQMIGMIKNYRAQGIDVTVDQYPYTASSTSLDVLLPSWALAGGPDSMAARLDDAATKQRILDEMKETLEKTGFENFAYAVVANFKPNPAFNGKSISKINLELRRSATAASEMETIFDLMLEGGAQMIYHKMSEEDVQRIMAFPWTMIASDGGLPAFGEGAPHPRNYGTNARVLGRYVRELGILTLEDAVRKMTSLPAARFKLDNRGLVRPGMAADIVIFSPEAVTDNATFEKPHAWSSGFRYVIVNGVPVIEEGRHTGKKAGRVLRK